MVIFIPTNQKQMEGGLLIPGFLSNVLLDTFCLGQTHLFVRHQEYGMNKLQNV